MSGYKTIWSVGGGKGGVGKSIAAANIGCALAAKGASVMLVDADLGGANLHTYFGIKYPPTGLDDFIKGRRPSLEEVAIDTDVKGLRLISGAGEFLGIANPAYAQKQKLISHIKRLNADYIIVDLGAGSSYNVLDFFAISNEGIVVLVPEPAAIQNAYIFLKSFVYRRLTKLFSDNPLITEMIKEATDLRSPRSVKSFSDLCGRMAGVDRRAAERALAEIKSFRPKLLLNMAASKDDLKVVDAFKGASSAFLSLDTDFVGVLYMRPSVKSAARKMHPFMLDASATDARADMEGIVANLLRNGQAPAPAPDEARAEPEAGEAPRQEGRAPEAGEERHGEGHEVFGFNDNVSHMGMVCHVQTEVQGGDNPLIETIIYNGGRIFFSKKTSWSDVVKGNGGAPDVREYAARQHRAAMAAIKMNKIALQG